MRLMRLAFTAPLAFAFSAFGQDVDLSPSNWDATTRSYLEEFNWTGSSEIDKPLASGSNGAITASFSAPAVYAGLQALRQGGTAADAALTTALTQVVLVGGSFVSYSGYLGMLYYEAETDAIYNLDAGFNSVLGETDPLSIPRERSGRNVLVPGFMAGVEAAQERFGELPWATIFEPAIFYAENGFRLPQWFEGMLRAQEELLSRLSETRSVFTRPDGELYREGDQFRQPQLARVLRRVASDGASYMYTGEWAENFVDSVRSEGGTITLDDMLAYEVLWSQPLQTSFAGHDVFVSGLPAAGGVNLIEALNLARLAGLEQMDGPVSSPEDFYWQTQIANVSVLMYASDERLSAIGEDLGMEVTLQTRSELDYASALWDAITEGRLSLAKPPQGEPLDHTDAIVVVDQWGNIASVHHTINDYFSDLYVDGVSVSHAARFQQSLLERVEPGQRLPSGINSVITMREGKPYAALASIGTGLYQATFSVVLNLLSSNLDIKAAVDGPLVHNPTWNPEIEAFTSNVIDGDYSDEFLDQVRALGLDIDVHERPGNNVSGSVVGIVIDPETGARNAAGARGSNALPYAY